jgi:predicted Zn-dependent peptidase
MIERKILSNGMTVVFKKRTNKVVSVAFAVRYGGANEKKEHKGIAHFIEHMLYKGTPTRDAHKISTEIEKNGGELNGFTSEQVTAYWCKIPSKHLNVALDVLSDMVKNPLFDQKELDKERKVIFEEMKMYKDNPRMYVFEKIKSLLYSGDFSIPIIGTESSMKRNTRERLKSFFDEIYVPENLILCVVGDANFKSLCDFAEKNFKKKKTQKLSKVIIEKRNNEMVERRKSIDQANLVFAYHTPLFYEKEYFSAQVLTTLMAGGMSSRLFSEIREKRNLAYAVKGFMESEKDFSFSGVYIGTTPDKVKEVKNLIIEEFQKLKDNLKTEEVELVKEQIIGNKVLSEEDSHNIMLDLLFSEIRNNACDSEKFLSRIKSVRVSDVKKVADFKKHSFFALIPE